VKANSRREAFAEINIVIRVNRKEAAENINHQSGYCHHLTKEDGENWVMMLANTMQGKAISIARTARKRRIFSGIIFLLMIQNPNTPMASKAATDCNVTLKICIRGPLIERVSSFRACGASGTNLCRVLKNAHLHRFPYLSLLPCTFKDASLLRKEIIIRPTRTFSVFVKED
jgi:hypothetical protein